MGHRVAPRSGRVASRTHARAKGEALPLDVVEWATAPRLQSLLWAGKFVNPARLSVARGKKTRLSRPSEIVVLFCVKSLLRSRVGCG